MSAQENIENILRCLHILLSKSEPYAKEPSKVIIDKSQILDLLTELNKSVYDIMDEYELTKQSRDRAEREFQKKGDKIIGGYEANLKPANRKFATGFKGKLEKLALRISTNANGCERKGLRNIGDLLFKISKRIR